MEQGISIDSKLRKVRDTVGVMRNLCCVSKVRLSICVTIVLAMGLGGGCHSSLRVGRTHVDASTDGKRDAVLADGSGGILGTGGAVSTGGVGADSAMSTDGAINAMDVGGTGPLLKLIAGKLGGPGDLDGIGSAARFTAPFAVASDGAGSLFVAEQDSHTIRRIDAANGAVTTLAGAHNSYGSTDGIGTSARFRSPSGVASDGAGNLFVADRDNHTIRKVVVATGVVATFAGSPGNYGSTDGTGSVARFNSPWGLASDGSGNLFVADTGNNTIRMVMLTTGAVSTLAGYQGREGSNDGTGTAARFNFPVGLASDGMGNLFVADSGNNAIRKIVIATGAVSTIAVAEKFNYPYGVASDGAGSLFISDWHSIRKIITATGTVTMLAGSPECGSTDGTGTAARFCYPLGVASDSAGNLFVADYSNFAVRKVVVETGVVSTIAGSPFYLGSADGTGEEVRFKYPRGVASDGNGNLFVADTSNCTIRKVVLATGAVSTFAGSPGNFGSTDGVGTAARFRGPEQLTSDGMGNLFVADSAAIRNVEIATGMVNTLAGTANASGSIDGTGSDARFSAMMGVASDGSGNLYVADSGNHTIRKVAIATSAVTTIAGTTGNPGSTDGKGTAAQFNQPVDVAIDGMGYLFVADNGNHTIRRIVIATGVVTTLAGTAGASGSADGTGTTARFNSPRGITSDKAGNIFVADSGNHTIRKIVIATQAVTTVVGTPDHGWVGLGSFPASLSKPTGLAFGPSGELLISDSGENVILATWF
jgi:streptogramin lyase